MRPKHSIERDPAGLRVNLAWRKLIVDQILLRVKSPFRFAQHTHILDDRVHLVLHVDHELRIGVVFVIRHVLSQAVEDKLQFRQ